MEAKPVLKSISHYYELTNTDHLADYALALDKVANNPHKYVVVDNDIRLDMFGNPFVIFQYSDNIAEEEKRKKKYSYYGEIISIRNLEDFDKLVTMHWAEEIIITMIKEYSTKDKENPMHYKIVIYTKANDENILDKDKASAVMPVDKRK